jgi:hypothetical protein
MITMLIIILYLAAVKIALPVTFFRSVMLDQRQAHGCMDIENL